MLLNQLSHIVCNQLQQEPLVVLPSFGGFVKDEVSAKLDEHRNRIHPPKKTVIFNAKLNHNDGVLIAAAAQDLEFTYADADKWLTDAISELRFRLNNGESVVLDGLGTLNKNVEGKIEFAAVETPAIQEAFFGLKSISLKPVEKDNVDKARELVAADGPIATKVRTLPIKRIASYAAAAIAVGFMVWMPIQNGMIGNGKMLVNQLNPFSVATDPAYSARQFEEGWLTKGFEQEDVLADKFNHEFLQLHLTKGSKNAIVVKTDAVPSEEVRLEEIADESTVEHASSYQVIAATFSTKKEATKYVSDMIKRGFSAEYAGKDAQGHLVAYGTYTSMEDAQRMLKSVSLSNKEARIVSGS